MDLYSALKNYFGYTKFRVGQEEIIESILKCDNVLAMLPTGTGKSICYQLPALLLPRITVIVSPLLSLMEDQVQQLKSSGIKKVVALNSFLSNSERQTILTQLHKFKMIYVSPEILQNPMVITALKKAKVSLFVVDEAHCISQWGYEFRTDYLKLNEVHKELGSPPCLAITATATSEVQQDIISELELSSVQRHIYSVDRPNIAIKVCETATIEQKKSDIIELVSLLQGPGIIYFSSRRWSELMTAELKKSGVNKIAFYHGGMENEDRILIQQQFIEGELDVICCTSAFGMGINKANVRYVIHFHYPSQIESYLQEIGRAGRDGQNSIAILYYSNEDANFTKQLTELDLPSDITIRKTLSTLMTLGSSGIQLNQELEKRILIELDLTETMWRFLKFHLTNMNVIVNNQIIISDINKAIFHLNNIVKKRIDIKKLKLTEMENWINLKSCRREEYLRYFKEDLNVRPRYCCDICEFELDAFFKKEKEIEKRRDVSWRKRLKQILHQIDEVE